MSTNITLTEKVREFLAQLPDLTVEEKQMFRGTTFMVNGKMCVTTGDERLMCRIDPAVHDHVLETKNCETMKMKNREYRGYVYVHENDLKSKKEFDYWMSLALSFNKKAKASKKRK